MRIVTDFSSPDPEGQEILKTLSEFPEYSVERAEMEAHLFLTLARVSWREADRRQQSERQRAVRAARTTKKKESR